MALSGSIKTNSYSGRYYTLSWTATQSISSNTSTIIWTIKTAGGKASWYAERTLKAVINGKTVYSKTNRVERYAGTVTSGTTTIEHNIDGTKSFSLSIKVACYTESVNLSASGTATLNSIPRMATIVSAPSFTDEDNPVIKYSNPVGATVTSLQACISLTGSNDDVAYRDIPTDSTSYTFELTDDERTVLRNATATANSRTVTFYIRTVIGEESHHSTLDATLSIVNCSPTLSPSVVDINSNMIALTGNSNVLVKYKSNAKYAINAAALKGASIASVKVTSGGVSNTTETGTFAGVTSGQFEFSATDTRGNTTTRTITKTLIEYLTPTCSLKVSRPTADGDATLTISGAFFNGSFGATTNPLYLYYRKKTGNGSYGSFVTVTPSLNGNTYSATVSLTGLDYQSSHTFQVQYGDMVLTSLTQPITVKSIPVFDWGADDFKFNVPVLDHFGTTITNGMAIYTGSGDSGIDPNTTLEHLIITDVNTPNGGFMYIKTEFYHQKNTAANRMQTAFPYNKDGSPYFRRYVNGSWSDWAQVEVVKAEEPADMLSSTGSSVTTNNNAAYSLGRFTPTEDGVYGFSGWVKWAGNSNGLRTLFIRIMSTTVDIGYDRRYPAGSSTIAQNVAGFRRLTAGTEVRLQASQNSGDVLTINDYAFDVVKLSS